MERLTKRNADGSVGSTVNCQNGCQYLTCNLEEGYQCKHECEADIYLKLAEYEDLEEQGQLMKLPCKVGDVLYWINSLGECCQCVVERIYIDNNLSDIQIEVSIDTIRTSFSANKLNKTVFLTKEETAKKTLKEMEEK